MQDGYTGVGAAEQYGMYSVRRLCESVSGAGNKEHHKDEKIN